MLRGILVAIVLSAAAMLLTTCGGSHRVAPSDQIYPPGRAATDPSLDSALAELAAYPCPEGVDAELFAQLKDALAEALKDSCRAGIHPRRSTTGMDDGGHKWPPYSDSSADGDGHSMLCPYKSVATPPTDDDNRVNDLTLTDHYDATYTLSWRYRNLGDYDQNGTVGISDITPLAIHYNEEVPEDDTEQRNSIQAVVDGSGNDIVDIADITPIAMNYGTECAQYSIRSALSHPENIEDTTEIGTAPVALAEGEDRKVFSVELAEEPRTYIAVAPMDAEETPGELSNMVIIPNHPPVAQLLANPIEGDAPLDVAFDASGSSDIDGPIVSYEWDWEGDGVFDHDSGSVPTVEHTYDIAQIYDPQVRVMDEHNGTDTADVTVTAGSWHIFVAVDVEECYDNAWHVNLEVVNGHPAISYWGSFDGLYTDDFVYVRANDPDGTTWGETVLIASGDWIMEYSADNSLAVVNGRPAIACYMDYNDERGLWYVRAMDENGSAWSEPLWIGEMDEIAENGLSMAVVDERPAIAYQDGQLQYIRALDANGDEWGSPVVADPEYDRWMSLAVVNGKPAICYSRNQTLNYVRALDAAGTAWGESVTVDPEAAVIYNNPIVEVNGRPAIAYVNVADEPDYKELRYVRANDSDGNTWGIPAILDSAPEQALGTYCSMAIVRDRPSVIYTNSNSSTYVVYMEARDINGEEWRKPAKVDEKSWPWLDSLKEVNGHPAVAYSLMGEVGNRQVRFAIYY